MSSSRDMAVANFMPQCADFVFICVLTGFLQTAIKKCIQHPMKDKDIHASLSGIFTLSKIEAERCRPPVSREYSSIKRKKQD